MSLIKKLLFFVVAVAVMAFGALFFTANSESISVDMLFFSIPSIPIGIFFILVFVAGFLLGLLASSAAIMRHRARSMMLQRKLNKNEKLAAKIAPKASA